MVFSPSTVPGSARLRWKHWLSVIAFLLSLPLVAMEFTDQVRWTTRDFVAMALLLAGLAAGIEGLLRLKLSFHWRIVLILMLILSALVLWIEAAVGIFDSPISGT